MYRIIIFILFYTLVQAETFDSLTYKGYAFINNDSAIIIRPNHLSNIETNDVIYEIKTRCSVKKVDLIVNHYPSISDTLARLTKPPYLAYWNCKNIEDHDQIQFQFTYVLYHQNGDTIISPPQPHHWIINRTQKKSKMNYRCKQALSEEEYVIDGNLNDWKRIQKQHINTQGNFKVSWTSSLFYLAIEVHDTFGLASDRVEICFDIPMNRSQFFGKNQRIISFSPKIRSFPWAIDINDTGYVLLDSVIIRINEEMVWRCLSSNSGYTIEAKIPLCVLSSLEFPPKKIGFDISIVNGYDSALAPLIISWSGSSPSERFNPEGWGTLTLHPIFAPLKLILTIILVFAFFIIAFIVAISLYRNHQDTVYEKSAAQEMSPLLKKAFKIIEKKMCKKNLSIYTIAQECQVNPKTLNAKFWQELDTSCQEMIGQIRIKKAKLYLVETDWNFIKIRKKTGYKSLTQFKKDFKLVAGVSAEEWRIYRLDDALEDDNDEQDSSSK